VRHRKPENWLAAIGKQGDGIAESRPLAPGEQAAEALLMGLRLGEGVDLTALAGRFGIARDALCDPAKAALYEGQGLLRRDGSRLIVTDAGMPLLDALLGELVPADLVAA